MASSGIIGDLPGGILPTTTIKGNDGKASRALNLRMFGTLVAIVVPCILSIRGLDLHSYNKKQRQQQTQQQQQIGESDDGDGVDDGGASIDVGGNDNGAEEAAAEEEDATTPPPTLSPTPPKFPPLLSTGPFPVNPHIPGLVEFHDVCLTKHSQPDSDIQGLVYFTPYNQTLVENPLRCCPCSAPLFEGGWDHNHRDEKDVGHKCGFHSTHLMYASGIEDWSDCVSTPVVRAKMDLWSQRHLPSSVETMEYVEEPTFALNFRADNIGHSFFDMLLTYLPHWDLWRKNGGAGRHATFPFTRVASLSSPGCLSSSKNTHWFCMVLRAMNAFGDGAMELPQTQIPPHLPYAPDAPYDANTTLTCYKSVYVVEHAVQRHIPDHKLFPKPMISSFRDTLFEKAKLPRHRDYHHLVDFEDTQQNKTKILLYAHKPSNRRVWTNMDELVTGIRNNPDYRDILFDTVEDFGALSFVEQARTFNSADIHVMVHGAQMVNSIFAVDGSFFYELGCSVPTFVGNEHFMDWLDGHHKSVEECPAGSLEDAVCVVCEGSDYLANFHMKKEGFVAMVDQVLKKFYHNHRLGRR